jgi:hypothetical protein
MAEAGVVKDKNRLPWLEPYRAPTGRKSNRRAGVTAAIGAIGLAAVVTLLTRDMIPLQVEQPAPQVSTVLPAPAELQPPIVLPALEPVEEPVAVAPAAPPAKPHKAYRPQRNIKTAPTRISYRQVMKRQAEALGMEVPAEEEAAKPDMVVAAAAIAPTPSNPPLPAVNRTAQVVRGKTIQLGVYMTAAQADLVWRNAIREYTYLVTLPKSIEPVRIRSKRFYRLQLGTPSRSHATQVCSNLKSIGRACTVA